MTKGTTASTSSGGAEDTKTKQCVEEFESLLQILVTKPRVFEHELIDLESKIIRAVVKVSKLNLNNKLRRKLLSDWLALLGLTSVNIRHLEICSIVDLHTLIETSPIELRSLADRGRFSTDAKRRLLKSNALLAKLNQSTLDGKEDVFKEKDLSWSYDSPSSTKKFAPDERKSSSASPPSERPNLERRPGASVDLEVCESKETNNPEASMSTEPDYLSTSTSTGGSLSLLSTSSSTSLGMCSMTLSPPSPNSTQSTPSLGVGSRVVQSSSMQFGPPKSPKTSRLVHAIPHKWHRSTKFRFSGDAVCHFCQRPLGFGFLNAWEKCISCRWKVHTQCKSRVGDSCGLTPEHLRFLFDKLIKENNGGMWNDPQSAVPLPGSRSMNENAFQYPDTAIDSSSSTNSSAPSTPALPLGVASSPFNPLTAPYRSDRKFLFPETVAEQTNNVPILVISEGETSSQLMADDAYDTRIGEGSEGTIVVDSTGSATDTGEPSSSKTPGLSGGHTWDRHTWNMSTIRGPNAQASWNEVTIPFQNIELNRKIGTGRFGDVWQGYHFGDVAVKMLNMDHIEESRRLEEFKQEVSGHKNTRHDNIILFLGYCMEDGNFGIVMSFCRGRSLFTVLHELRERIDPPNVLVIAQQICQGVSYLHTKKILHKDLRSKNIFIESKNKVVITDFGIFSMKRLNTVYCEYGYVVPKFWLSYLAPELVRAISADSSELPFSESSDVFSFGTVWYELLTGSIPLQKEPWERAVWMVGHGLKASFRNVECAKEVKDSISRCWSMKIGDRPSLSDIQNMLATFPKKRLDRSPSFPTMLRSHESKF